MSCMIVAWVQMLARAGALARCRVVTHLARRVRDARCACTLEKGAWRAAPAVHLLQQRRENVADSVQRRGARGARGHDGGVVLDGPAALARHDSRRGRALLGVRKVARNDRANRLAVAARHVARVGHVANHASRSAASDTLWVPRAKACATATQAIAHVGTNLSSTLDSTAPRAESDERRGSPHAIRAARCVPQRGRRAQGPCLVRSPSLQALCGPQSSLARPRSDLQRLSASSSIVEQSQGA